MALRTKQAAPLGENTSLDTALVNSFKLSLRADNKSPQTQRHYLGAVSQFVEFCNAQGLPPLANIYREHVELWLVSLYARLAVASVRNRFVGLQQFYKWLREEGEIDHDPMERIKRPVLEETSKDVVPANRMAEVFTHLEKAKDWRMCTILAIFYDTGIRETELANTLTKDVDLEHGELLIPRTKNKTQRTIPLTPKVVRYIDRYWRTPRKEPEYLINGKYTGKMTGKGLYQAVRFFFRDLGYPAIIGPHDLRHTSATTLALNGMEEAKLMKVFGWKDVKMARRYSAQAQQKIALDSHRLLSPMENLPTKKR